MKRQQHIQHAYQRIAKHYLEAATVQQEIGNRLFERLSLLTMVPQTILDLGCGVGNFIHKLKAKYPKAQIIGVDLSPSMLQCYKTPWLMRNKPKLIVADMEHLPLASHSIDMIFANQALHWANQSSLVFAELYRVLRPEGVLLFSTVGPDTCQELRKAWQQIDAYPHVNQFKDMHDLGDELLANHFIEPVVDMEYIQVRYSSPQKLLYDLKSQGNKNLNPDRLQGLTGKNTLQQLFNTLNQPTTGLQLTYEVIYGQAWKAKAMSENYKVGNEVRIPLSTLRKKH